VKERVKKHIQILLGLGLILIGINVVQAQEFLPIWPEGKMPNSKGLSLQDSVHNQRIYRAKTPGILPFFPSQEENSKAAIIICPGGGYDHITYIWSGTQLAKWFNSFGVNAFVLKYRLPNSPDLKQRELGPWQDLQRAMRYVRAQANSWKIDPDKIGVMGISAGGNMVTTLGTHPRDVSAIGDSLDKYAYKPDFMVLVSPVITLGKYTHEGTRDNLLGPNPSQELIREYSNELHVSEYTPPTFLAHAGNDPAVSPLNSLIFYQELLKYGTPSTLHIFPFGGHGIALIHNPPSTQLWTDLCKAWLRETGIIESKNQ